MQNWYNEHACQPSKVMEQLWESTSNLEDAEMLTSPEQLQFLAFLATSIGAVNAIEIGVYTGASALAIAEVLPKNGTLVACDLTDKYLPYAMPADAMETRRCRADYQHANCPSARNTSIIT